MRLTVQKRLAADVLNCSPNDVRFVESKLAEVKEAITRTDIRVLVAQGVILKARTSESSRSRARENHIQKVKGKRKGQGSRKGTSNARENAKLVWMNKVRAQRELIKELKEKKLISNDTYRDLYLKVKGGYFRNKRHIKLFIGEKQLLQKK